MATLDAAWIADKTEKLLELFEDGFQLADLGNVAAIAVDGVALYREASVKAKVDAVLAVLHNVIDRTDTPWLPDSVADPAAKAILDAVLPPVLSRLL